MRQLLLFIFIIVIFSEVPLHADTSSIPRNCITYQVKKGESISLICIDIYGYYSPNLGKAIQKLNPRITNIDLIYPGQSIFVRMAASASSDPIVKQSASAAKERLSDGEYDTLFVKRAGIKQGVVTYVEGTVWIRPYSRGRKSLLYVNRMVFPGDTIETSHDGRIELIINRETVLRCKENTRICLDSLRNPATDRGWTHVFFKAGTVWTKMKQFKDKIRRFECELPLAIAGVHGTVYETSVNSDRSSEVKVYNGEVSLSGLNQTAAPSQKGAPSEVNGPYETQGPQEVPLDTWTEIVTSMQKVHIDKSGKPSSPQSFTSDSTDDWEKWNVERDKRINSIFGE